MRVITAFGIAIGNCYIISNSIRQYIYKPNTTLSIYILKIDSQIYLLTIVMKIDLSHSQEYLSERLKSILKY